MKKIFKFNQIDNFLKINKNKKIILCHGKFDFLHYGHIAHLKKAKKLGDLLIVSITMKGYSNDDSKIYFSDEVRAKHLLELDLVNCVLLVPFFNVVPVIKKIKPYYYCKGLEYNNYKNFSNKEIVNDIKIAKAVGSKVKFVGDQILSSSKIINSVFRKKETELSKKVIPDNFSLKYLEDLFVKMSKLKVMVIGDLIIDRYTFVKGNSLSSKNNILSSVKIKTENYFGGAASSYFHLKDFVKNLKFLSLINKKDFHHISKNFSNSKLFTNNNFKTIIKHKYVQDEGKNIELKKYFSVTDINEDFYSENLEKKILKYLKSEIFKYDLVMVLDFGHNFFTKRIIRFIERNSRSLSVNCQTNSLNYGYNIINSKYKKADSFTLDKTELMLASGIKNEIKFENSLKKIKSQLKSQYAWLTLGNKFTLGIKNKQISKIPPLSNFVKDSVGAGDAFYSISSLLMALKVDINIATFLSQVAGSINVRNISNKKPLDRSSIKNFIKDFH